MRLEFDGKGFRSELVLTHRLYNNFSRAIPADVEKVSRATMYTIKRMMPKDTGRAAATWGIFTPEFVVYISTRNPLAPEDAIWRVLDEGLTIEQGLDLQPHNYVDELNAGSSTQAPALFLDVAAEQAGNALQKAIFDRTNQL